LWRLSHEFRTPLTTIRQLSELLARSRVSTDDRKQQFHDAILSESERLQRLVESLLDFGRIEAGRLTYALEPLDLEPLLAEVAGHVSRTAAPSGHRIEVRTAAPVPPIRGDRDALGHAIRNLLDNAVKYSPDHKVVELSLAGNHRTVSIQVRDRGLGIPRAEQQDIFETFVRGTSAGVRRVAGTGVGLAMVRQIVEAHRGTISLESAPGEGSTFTIHLPAEQAAHP
jgi:signal transduction histidine kinase